MTGSAFAGRLQAGLEALGLVLSPEQQAQLLAYLDLIGKWNRVYNLTALRDPDEMFSHHLLDSLAVTLLDSNGKKVRFLRQVIAELKVGNAQAVQTRVEEHAARYDVVTSRAFATLADMLEWSGQLAGEGGEFLAMKGQRPDAEIAALPAGYAVTEVLPLAVPFLDEERHLVRIVRGDTL